MQPSLPSKRKVPRLRISVEKCTYSEAVHILTGITDKHTTKDTKLIGSEKDKSFPPLKVQAKRKVERAKTDDNGKKIRSSTNCNRE